MTTPAELWDTDSAEEREATAEQGSPYGDVRAWQQGLVRGVLRALTIVGPLAVLAGSYYAYVTRTMWLVLVYLAVYSVLLLITFWRRAPYSLQAGIILALIYGLAVLDFVQDGRGGSGRVFLLGFLVLAVMLFGRRGGAGALTLSLLTTAAFGLSYSLGWLSIPVDREIRSADPVGWLSNTVVLGTIGVLLFVSQNQLVPRLAEALTRSRSLARQLEEERAELQKRVAERTADLAQRTAQLEAAARVAREATAIRDVSQLLDTTAHLISERFGFYHAGIFLLDKARRFAVLHAASSEGGMRMLARDHQLPVGEQGIVGFVAASGEPRIALDVGKDAVFFDNPDLPLTRSEMALPLRVRHEVIGVLDVQSTEAEAFSEQDVAVLQALADQLAVTISNARLFQQTQRGLELQRHAHGQLDQGLWREILRAQRSLHKRYDPNGILPPLGDWREDARLAAEKGEPVLGTREASATLCVPIKVRGQVIGVLDAHKADGDGDWTREEVELLKTLIDQLAAALDSARLYQDAQGRASREQLVAELSGRIRETLDLETVLQTAAREVRQALGLPEVVVRLAPRPESASEKGGGRSLVGEG